MDFLLRSLSFYIFLHIQLFQTLRFLFSFFSYFYGFFYLQNPQTLKFLTSVCFWPYCAGKRHQPQLRRQLFRKSATETAGTGGSHLLAQNLRPGRTFWPVSCDLNSDQVRTCDLPFFPHFFCNFSGFCCSFCQGFPASVSARLDQDLICFYSSKWEPNPLGL